MSEKEIKRALRILELEEELKAARESGDKKLLASKLEEKIKIAEEVVKEMEDELRRKKH